MKFSLIKLRERYLYWSHKKINSFKYRTVLLVSFMFYVHWQLIFLIYFSLFFQAYIGFVRTMGGLWLERNISLFLNHVLNLVANPKATPTHVDAVYARKCVLFIMRCCIGELLGEKAQIAAAKEICQIIIKQMNTVGKI